MKKYCLIIFCFCLSWAGTAQDATFTVELSTDSLLFGNYVEVKFTLENAQGQAFSAPDFQGFQVVSGPNQSMMTSIVNGSMTQQVSYTYYLEPNDIGNYYITPASIKVRDGEVLETAPTPLIVLPNPDGIKQNPRKETNSFFSFPNWGRRSFPAPQEKEAPKKKVKKKRKVYKL